MGQIVDRSKPGKDGKFRPWIRQMCGRLRFPVFDLPVSICRYAILV